jgi:stress response protein YsnF
MIIVREDGGKGSVLRRIKGKGKPDKLVIEFEDGTRLTTTEAQLKPRDDGTALLLRSSALSNIPFQAVELAPGEELVIPVAAEQIQVQKRPVVRGVIHVRTRVETTDQTVDERLVHEEVIVERIRIDKEIGNEYPKIHEHNGVLVIPVVEEVLVVSKQLRLKEELRVIRRKKTVHEAQTVQVRRQVVEVERVKPEAIPDERGQNQVPLPAKTMAPGGRKSARRSSAARSDTSKQAAPTTRRSAPVEKVAASKKKGPSRASKKKGK